jgi:ribonuclease III
VPRLDPGAAEAAFVHESAAKEGSESGAAPIASNERLEFLGDAVLGQIVARYLYERYPDASQGELTLRKSWLVSDAALAESAERLGLGALLVLGKGVEGKGGPTRSMLADAFEAFVAVLARTAGSEAAAAFVRREHVEPRERGGTPVDDPKTILQEWSQRHYAAVPRYEDRFDGPAHDRTFFAAVDVNGERIAEGTGKSKKDAQRAAATRALQRLSERFDDVAGRKLSAPVQSSGRPASKKLRP